MLWYLVILVFSKLMRHLVVPKSISLRTFKVDSKVASHSTKAVAWKGSVIKKALCRILQPPQENISNGILLFSEVTDIGLLT